MNDLIQRLRSGTHNEEPVTVGGVEHDKRCLEAADEIKRLEAQLAISRIDALNEAAVVAYTSAVTFVIAFADGKNAFRIGSGVSAEILAKRSQLND